MTVFKGAVASIKTSTKTKVKYIKIYNIKENVYKKPYDLMSTSVRVRFHLSVLQCFIDSFACADVLLHMATLSLVTSLSNRFLLGCVVGPVQLSLLDCVQYGLKIPKFLYTIHSSHRFMQRK